MLQLSSAAKQIRQEYHQSGQEVGENLVPVLDKIINSKLVEIDLLSPSRRRCSVIARNNNRPSSTSTPSGSPTATPSVIKFLGPQTPTSPGSNISSIYGDPFDEIENSSLPESLRAPGACITPNLVVIKTMEDFKKQLTLQERKLRQKVKNFDLDRVTEDVVTTKQYQEKLNEIENMKDEFVFAIEDFLEDYSNQVDPIEASAYKSKIDKWEVDIKQHCISIQNKAAVLRKEINAALSNNKASVVSRTIPLGSASTINASNVEIESLSAKKKDAAKAKAKSKWDVICFKSSTLTDKTRACPDWSTESDLVISRTMKDLKIWEEDLNKVNDLYQELTEHLIDWEISEIDCSIFGAKDIIEGLQKDVTDAVTTIRDQDDARALYTLDSNKHELVKYPTYQGLDSEDFALFKSKVQKAFETNRVIMSDRITKLRSCLKGNALSLVPESSVKSIDDAWSALESAYGSPERLMRSKKDAIAKLGSIPKENSGKGQPNFKNQITWFLQLESLISEIIALGSKSVELEKEAFSPSHINSIIGLFRGSNAKMLQLAQCPGSGSSQLSGILAKVSAMRSDAQKLLNITLDADQTTSDSNLHVNSGQRRLSKSSSNCLKGLVAYNPPRKDNDCRICKALEAEGDTDMLYEDHHHNYPTGCPRYITMTIVERYRIACKAKLCLKCHEPSYLYKRFDKSHKCSADGKKSKFSCRSCSYHMWICHRHQADNQAALNRFKDDELRRHNLEFGLFVTTLNSSSEKSSNGSVESSLNDCSSISVPTVVVENKQQENLFQNLSQNQALSKLKRKLNSKPETRNVKLKLNPSGCSQFMLGQSQGKTRPVITLYDTGCSAALFKEGVPQTELSPAVLMTRGPFMVNGVGDSQVKVNDLWMCSVPLCDGSRQPLEEWAVNKVTGTFPMVDMSAEKRK